MSSFHQARTLVNIGCLCVELVGTRDLGEKVKAVNPHRPDASESIEEMVKGLIAWYDEEMTQGIKKIMEKDI